MHGFVIYYKSDKELTYGESQKKIIKDVLDRKRPMSDSTVLNVLSRNNNWDNMVIVCDMTQSMTPYIAEILLWYNLNFDTKKNQAFVFFNDGNRTPDEKKKIGKTGGVYSCNKQNIDSILNTAVLTMDNGTGGDGPENDVEAILYAIKKFPEKETVVLIADNLSTMRDYSLIPKIKKPVKIILCGLTDRLNSEYLDMARSTGGSLHTIETDIVDLIQYNEGQTVKIGNDFFKIINGRFILTEEK
jgi:hypothetical protein